MSKAYSCSEPNIKMSRLFQQPAKWFARGPNRRRRIWLLILSSVWLFADPIKVSTLSGVGLKNQIVPNVSVLMSTSIVESANYQPVEAVDQASKPQRQEFSDKTPRLLRSQDSFADRSDNLAFRSSSQQQPTQALLNSQPIPTNQAGRILESAPNSGYRWSVSTSRTLSPGALQVLSQPVNQPLQFNHVRSGSLASDGQRKQTTENSSNRKLFRRILDGGQQAISDLRCEGRGVGKMLKSAKNLIQERVSSLEDQSGLMMLGSGLLAATIPMAVLYSTGTSLSDLAQLSNRRATSDGSADSPLSMLRYFSLHSRADSMMGWIERSVEHLPTFPRLHPQECVKRSICEAHNNPEKYGAVGFILRLLFPAISSSSTDRMDNMDFKVINKYRHAAGFGLNKRIDSNGTNVSACKEKYEDCLVSLLDVARNMMDVFLK